jgi:hypothetical protein
MKRRGRRCMRRIMRIEEKVERDKETKSLSCTSLSKLKLQECIQYGLSTGDFRLKAVDLLNCQCTQ